MKTYGVTVSSYQLPSAHAEYFYRVEAGCWHVAANRAVRLFEREPHVRGRRLVGIAVHCVSVTTVQQDAERHTEPRAHT